MNDLTRLNRTFYGIETPGLVILTGGIEVLIVPFMELKLCQELGVTIVAPS